MIFGSKLGLLLASVIGAAAAAEIPASERRSGYDFMSAQTRAVQDDDTSNPALLGILEGETLWNQAPSGAKSCADCHGPAASGLKGVAVRYPAYNPGKGALINLEQRINLCRAEKQNAPALRYESKELLALTAYVARQSRGEPIAPRIDEATRPFLEAGQKVYETRQGQLNLACAQCHDDNWSQRLAGSPITQAHPTGYPIYRLEWQSLGSLQRRLRNCITGMRAQTYEYGAPEYVNLELYLLWRARGMPSEAPAVRP
jgi:sulfur-oxidizing protein SoxA